jgi:hypothetical protein
VGNAIVTHLMSFVFNLVPNISFCEESHSARPNFIVCTPPLCWLCRSPSSRRSKLQVMNSCEDQVFSAPNQHNSRADFTPWK